ncbi:MAG: hypothetical protein Q4D29_02660 [Lachnospiraceae bacterium]|nr:hypothetical protein [Lachnospiraceae bacterium]
MNKSKSRTSLVLMELIITILFFSLASAVCVQLFVRAHLTTKATRELNNAISITQSISEVMNGTDGSLNSVKEFYKDAEGDNNYFVIYYNDNFEEVSDIDSAVYAVDITIDRVGNLYNMTTDFLRLSDYEVIYSLQSSKFIRKINNN